MRKFNNNSFVKVTYRKINPKPKSQSLPYGIWSRRIVDYLARLDYLSKNKNKNTTFTISEFLKYYKVEENQDNINLVALQIQLLRNCEFDVLMKPKSGLTTNYNNIRFFGETSDLTLSTELKKILRSHPIPISNAVAGIEDCFTYDLFNYVHYVNFSATKYKQKIDIEIDELYETLCNKEMQGRRREGNPHDYFANANKTKLEKFKAQLNQSLNEICKISPIIVEVEKTKTIKGWISGALISNYGSMIITPTPDALFKRVDYPTIVNAESEDNSANEKKDCTTDTKLENKLESSEQNTAQGTNNVYKSNDIELIKNHLIEQYKNENTVLAAIEYVQKKQSVKNYYAYIKKTIDSNWHHAELAKLNQQTLNDMYNSYYKDNTDQQRLTIEKNIYQTTKKLSVTFNFDDKFDKLIKQIINPAQVIIKGLSHTYIGFLYVLWHTNKTNKLQVQQSFSNDSIEHLIFELFSFMWSDNNE